MIKIGFFVSCLLLAAGEVTAASDVGSIAGAVVEGGAVVVLAVTAYFLFRDNQAQRKERKEERKENASLITTLCERQDGWEKIRHEDSEKHNEVLRGMSANCAAVNARKGID